MSIQSNCHLTSNTVQSPVGISQNQSNDIDIKEVASIKNKHLCCAKVLGDRKARKCNNFISHPTHRNTTKKERCCELLLAASIGLVLASLTAGTVLVHSDLNISCAASISIPVFVLSFWAGLQLSTRYGNSKHYESRCKEKEERAKNNDKYICEWLSGVDVNEFTTLPHLLTTDITEV